MQFHRIEPSVLIAKSLDASVLDQLCTASNTKADIFRQRYLPVLLRLAEYIQELPLSKTSYSEPGGALRFAVVSSLFTLRMAESVIFVTSGAEKRKALDPQYRFAAFTASLATVPLLVYYNVAIEVDRQEWSYLADEPNLFKRLANDSAYAVTWKKAGLKMTASMATLLLGRFFDTGRWKEFDPEVLKDFCDAINPAGTQPAIESPLAKITRMGHEKARAIEEKSMAQIYQAPEGVSSVAATVGMMRDVGMVPIEIMPKEPIQAPPPTPAAELPSVVKGWIQYLKDNQAIFKTIQRNESGNLIVPASAFSGIGMSAKELVDIMRNAKLVINSAAGLATLNSQMTVMIDPAGSIQTIAT